MSHSLTTPLVKVVGDDALLTCVVQNQQNYTLMWKRDSKEKIGTKILTANTERVTGDPRVSIIHEEGGEVSPGHHTGCPKQLFTSFKGYNSPMALGTNPQEVIFWLGTEKFSFLTIGG